MSNDSRAAGAPSNPLIRIFAWLAVGFPLLWGVSLTVSKAAALFR